MEQIFWALGLKLLSWEKWYAKAALKLKSKDKKSESLSK